MDVYLVPVGHGRHELYCEVPDEPDAPGEAEETLDASTFWGRMHARFIVPVMRRAQAAIRDAEREWRDRQAGRIEEPHGRWGRAKARMRAWIAEKVAEQRLLWHMRRQEHCALFHPSDIPGEQGLAMMRDALQRDAKRHRNWFIIHTVLFVASGLLALVPGPNLVAYIFLFRLAGHFFSMKGARQGLNVAIWTAKPCPELTELRAAVELPPTERGARVRAIGDALRLEHLATFFNRVAAV